MATLSSIRSPGVYIQELPAGSRPIEGVGTAIAAFVGITADGPYDQAIKVANWGQYTATFGTWVEGAYLPNAVYQYFNNGGGSAYITRIGSLSSDEGARASAELTSALKAGQGVYRIEAKEPGGAGDAITVTVEPKHEQEPPPEGEQAPPAEEVFTLVVQRGDTVERYEGVTPRKGGNNVVTALAESALVQISELGGSSIVERVPTTGAARALGRRVAAGPAHAGRLPRGRHRPVRHRRARGAGRRDDRRGPGPGGRVRGRADRRRRVQGGPERAHHALRDAEGPGRHPRHPARPERPAGARVGQGEDAVLVGLRDDVLAVAVLLGPAGRPGAAVPAERRARGHLGSQRRHPRACTRRRPTRSSPGRWTSS